MSTTTTITESKAAPSTEFIPSGDVISELNFYAPPADGSRPYNRILADKVENNFGDDTVSVKIHDLRGNEGDVSLDKEAFSFHKIPSTLSYSDYADEEKIKDVYYPEIEAIVKAHVSNAKEVVIFDHTIRRSSPGATRTPVRKAHIDQTQRSGVLRLKRHFSEERAEEIVSSGIRYQIINVWRPINGAVVSHPLAFADSSTFEEKDLVPIAHIYPHYEGETAAVKYNPAQKWWYASGQTSDEVTLIKCLDSWKGDGGKFRRVPHTAFVHPSTPEGARGRESIEVRCLIVG